MKYRGQIYEKYTCVFVKEIEQLQLTLPTAPVDPADINSITLERWKLTIKKHDEQTEAYNDSLANLYSAMMDSAQMH